MAGPTKVRPGSDLEAFPGRSWNQIVAQWYRNQANGNGSNNSGHGAGQLLTVKARNLTGATLNYGSCVALEGVAIPVADKENQVYGRPLLKAQYTEEGLNHAIIGVALKPVANGQVGPFAHNGPVWLRCNYTNLAHNFVELNSGSDVADSGTGGVPILARELSTTGEQWVLCLLGAVADVGTIFEARVSELTGVLPADATFSFDAIRRIIGTPPREVVMDGSEPVLDDGELVYDVSGTAENRSRTLEYGQWVVLFTRRDTGVHFVENGPGETSTTIRYFELHEDKAYTDAAKLAYPVDAEGNKDTDADPFYVVDDPDADGRGLFWGLAEYTDGDSEAAEWAGYRGHALLFTLDYNSTGIPGYRIIAMEGPAETVVVELDEDVGATTPGEVGVNFSGAQDMAGGPFQQRRPQFTGGGASPNFTAFDDSEIGPGAKSGEKWEVRWDRLAEYYVLWRKLAPNYIRIKGTTTATVDANDSPFNVDTVAVIQGDMPALDEGELEVYNAAKIPIANSTVAEFRWNESTEHWETEPLVSHRVRGLTTGAVSGSGFNIDNITLIAGSDPRTDPSSAAETLAITNDMEWDADDNAPCYAEKHADGVWRAYQIKCPA